MKKPGAAYIGNGQCTFSVWAPERKTMLLHLPASGREQTMQPDEEGYFTTTVENVQPGELYFFKPDGKKEYPDPASHFQPEGVHGPSAVVDHTAYQWKDQDWRGLPFKELVLYELHVGTFTEQGTFEAIIPRLEALAAVGINAIELMPVAQFPGSRNWGYDAVYPYAVQNSYGGPQGLKKLVGACHQHGIAVFLDVVYNHLGPEGNYFMQYGPYFTNQYCTPWGDALNFDGDWSDGVRDYFSGNPLHWFEHYHIDGLRCDAIHMVFDAGAVHFWELTHQKINQLQQKLGRPLYMIAESDLNSPRVVKLPDIGGYGFDAQWLDDFHHALYVLLDKNGKERYEDFGQLEQLAKAYTDGFVHSGEFVKFRKRKHGASSVGITGDKFVVFNLNHDQVGNRVKGERLCELVDFERLKMAAAAILLAPYVPMLFMGEEYADETPFFYFVSHSDKGLIRAVQEGRKKEFENYKWEADPPDPQDEKTFQDSKLQWQKATEGKHQLMLQWNQTLIHLRRTHPVLQNFNKNDIKAHVVEEGGLALHRQTEGGQQHLLCLFNFLEEPISYTLPTWSKQWTKLLDSKQPQWQAHKKPTTHSMPDKVSARQKISLPPCSVTVYASH